MSSFKADQCGTAVAVPVNSKSMKEIAQYIPQNDKESVADQNNTRRERLTVVVLKADKTIAFLRSWD